jgi:hypothetical protein
MTNAYKTNPMNCASCEYKIMNDDLNLHCYMFKPEPKDICELHTGKDRLDISVFNLYYKAPNV